MSLTSETQRKRSGRPAIAASNMFEIGPAIAMSAIPIFGPGFRFSASMRTGLPHPSPITKIMSTPYNSRWANGLSESRPIFFGVGSPSQYATSAWLAS